LRVSNSAHDDYGVFVEFERVHVEPHSHANEQIVWMLKGKSRWPEARVTPAVAGYALKLCLGPVLAKGPAERRENRLGPTMQLDKRLRRGWSKPITC